LQLAITMQFSSSWSMNRGDWKNAPQTISPQRIERRKEEG
jgi:hypothetical protein